MPGPEDDAEKNIAVLVSRLNSMEMVIHDLGVTLSDTRERLNYLDRDRATRAELAELAKSINALQLSVAKIGERLTLWSAANTGVTLVAATIAAIVGRSP